MQNRELFLKKFQEFVAIAGSKDMDAETIQEFFAPEVLDEGQMQLLLEYLDTQKAQTVLTIEEDEFIREYREGLSCIQKEASGEREALYERILAGDKSAQERLIEIYLPEIITQAKRLHKEGFFIGDLIQDGNIGLTLGVKGILEQAEKDGAAGDNDLHEETVRDAQWAHQRILEAVQDEISSSMELELSDRDREKRVIERVRALDEALTKLEKDLERKPTVDELAVEMELKQDDVLDILKLTGENIEEEA